MHKYFLESTIIRYWSHLILWSVQDVYIFHKLHMVDLFLIGYIYPKLDDIYQSSIGYSLFQKSHSVWNCIFDWFG